MATARADDIPFPSTLNVAEVGRVLATTAHQSDLTRRLDSISAYLLDRPYIENSLIGGIDTPEVLTVSLKAFDCVTYIETVLALAVSNTVEEFINRIRALRYEGGKIAWTSRNHYMVDWARNNVAAGFVENLTEGRDTVEKLRALNSIEGLPARDVTLRCFPKGRLARVSRMCKTGDLILFASTKRSLDVFHVGLLLERNGELLMRHATRTGLRVIEEKLKDFMGRNRMSGFILLRPNPIDFGS